MLANKNGSVKIVSVDPDLYICLTTFDATKKEVSRMLTMEIGRMTCMIHPRIETLDELLGHFVTYVAALSRLSVRDISSSGKIAKPCLTRLVQKHCGNFSDECVETMSKEEMNVPTGHISTFNKLKDDFREYTFDHIPEMVEHITEFVITH